MSRIILPGERAPNGAPQIFVPQGYEDGPVTVVGRCEICGEEFREEGQEQAWQQHVGACARRHADRLEEALEKRRRSVFNEENWDPEVADHLRDVAGKRMLEAVDKLGVERAVRDGHLEVRPNERAG